MIDPVEELALSLRARTPLVHLVACDETHALDTLDRVAQAAGRRLLTWTSTRGLGSLRATRWDATLCEPLAVLDHVLHADEGAVFALLDFHPYLANPIAVRRLRDAASLLVGRAITVVLVSPHFALPTELMRQVTVLDLGPPDATRLQAQLVDFAAVSGLRVERAVTDALVRAAQGLTTGEFAQALERARIAHDGLDERAVAAVLHEKRKALQRTGVIEAVEPGEGLDALGGLEVLKRWLEARADAFSERAKQFGLPAPKGLLLVGVQGAGKSLCARSAAAAWRLPLLRMDVGSVFSSALGASEANARLALQVAESVAPCVLELDEIEKAFAGASGPGTADGGAAARVFATFLTWLEARRAPVFVIATANAIEHLPPELLRKGRFDEIFFVDLPGPAERLEIAAIHLTRHGRDPAAFDLEALARASDGCSGAEIEQAIAAGLYHAFEADRALETRDVLRAIRETVPLSRTMAERVDALRRWAQGRARPASAAPATAALRLTV